MKIYVITDMHLAHENIKKYCGRPDSFEEKIIEACAAIIKEGDILINLGDVLMGKKGEEYISEFRKRVPGKHYLVLGNHDKYSKTKYLQWFDGVFDSLSLNGVYFSHHGVSTLPADCTYQIYGHHHNSPLPEPNKSWENSYRLSIEVENYLPVKVDTLIGRIAKGDNGEICQKQ